MSELTANHPDDESLDRLRAGLFDNAPDARARVERHLAACESCRQRARTWERMTSALALERDGAYSAPVPGKRHRPHRHGLAAAAAITLVVGLGVLGGWYSLEDRTQNSEPAPPDMFAELDFYLWLIEQEGGARSHEVGTP